MHSVSTVVTVDYFERFSKNYSGGKGFKVTKWTSVIVGVLGTLITCLIAAFPVKSLFFLFQEVIGLLGILALFIVKFSTPINFFIYPLIAIPVCVIGGAIFSMIFS